MDKQQKKIPMKKKAGKATPEVQKDKVGGFHRFCSFVGKIHQ